MNEPEHATPLAYSLVKHDLKPSLTPQSAPPRNESAPQERSENSRRRLLVGLSKLCFSAIVLTYILHRASLHDLSRALHLADGNWLFAAFLLFGAAHLLTSKRLQLLLHSRRLDLSLFNTFRLNLYGAFSGLFFLGFVSGDTVKLILIQQHYPKTKYATLACLITDRVLGLFGMIAITALAIGGEYSSIFHNQSLALSLVSVFAWAFGFCASYLLLHSIVTNQKTRDLLARKFKRRNQTVEFQLPPRSVTSIGAALAVCTHGLVAFSGYCVMRSLSIPLDFPKAFATLAVTGFCTAFPVSPGGIGVRESCLLILTKTFGYTSNEPVIALSALIFLMQLSWALIGAGLQFGWLRRNEEHISK